METRDILAELYQGIINESEAYAIIEGMMETSDDPFTDVGMSEQECTAYAYGAGPREIARWRFDGWPTTCEVCGRALVYGDPELGWMVRHSADGTSVLEHFSHTSR